MKQMNQKSNISISDDYFKKMRINLYNKHYNNNNKSKLNLIIIKSILSNRKTHLVATFKDYLLYDDCSEFLKRFYRGNESFHRLKKIYKYFKETSVIYPNYSPLAESKYIYSNIIKKQVVINKQENYKLKNYMHRKHYKEKNDNENKKGNIFFNSLIYKEILNESESFINLLFGVETKNKENKKYDKRKTDNQKEIEELSKLINIIENNENINQSNKKINKVMTYSNKNNIIKDKPKLPVNNSKISYNKIDNNKKSAFLNKYKKNYKNVIKIEKMNKIYPENNKNNEVSKENNDNTNSLENKNMVYHRKVNSTLIGDYLNKLDLPSNSNVVSLLKIANETYADTINKNSMREILYQTVKNTNGTEIKNNKNKIIHLQKFIQNNNNNNKINDNKLNDNKLNDNKLNDNKLNENSIKNSNSNLMNAILNEAKIFISPKMVNSRNNKINKMLKKISLPKTNYFGIKKRISPLPLSTRNYTSIISVYETNNQNTNNNDNNTLTNENIFNSINNINNINNVVNSNSVFSTCKKKDEHKSIYANPNFTGPYSKPKCLYKDKKFNGISAKKLFNKSNEMISEENEKNECKTKI